MTIYEYVKTIECDNKKYMIITQPDKRKKSNKKRPISSFCVKQGDSDDEKLYFNADGKNILIPQVIICDERLLDNRFKLLFDFCILHEIGHLKLLDEGKTNEYRNLYDELFCDMFAIQKLNLRSKNEINELKYQQFLLDDNLSLEFRIRISLWNRLLHRNIYNILNEGERSRYRKKLHMGYIVNMYERRRDKYDSEYAIKLFDKEINKWDYLY